MSTFRSPFAAFTFGITLCVLLWSVPASQSMAQLNAIAGTHHGENPQRLPPRQGITIRLLQAPSDQQVQALAQIGQPSKLTIAAKADPLKVLRTYCGGAFTDTYLKLVLDSNPGLFLAPENSARTLEVPPCAKVKRLPSIRISKGDTLDKILLYAMGVDQNEKINNCGGQNSASCLATVGNVAAQLNGGISLDAPGSLPVGHTVVTPTLTTWSTVVLKEGIAPADAIKTLQEASANSNSARIIATPTPELSLIRPLRSTDPLIKNSSCDASYNIPKPWPFDPDKLGKALDRETTISGNRGQLSRTVVRVADTGALGLEDFFPDSALAPDMDVRPGTLDMDTNMGHYGLAAGGRASVEPFNDDPDRLHGTEVADLVLGGLDFRQTHQAIYKLIGLNFANVFQETSDNHIEGDEATLSNSLFLKPPQPNIINVSVGGPQANPGFRDEVQHYQATNLLVVVAAGNNNQDLNISRLYPAWDGGDGALEGNMIVVGADQPDGTRAPFSNFGLRRVDILAPGCRIKLSSPGASSYDAGTSFAAPLVTFAAAISHALGITDPLDVKRHLIASADYDPKLEKGDTTYGARLNILRSVESLYDDVVTNETGDDVLEKWQRPDFIALCKGQTDFPSNRILRVDSFDGDQHVRMLRVLLNNAAHGIEEQAPCAASDSGISVQAIDQTTGNAGPVTNLSWNAITAFVPARFPAQ